MHLRQIEAFRALMLTQTEVGAAELLGISQPAISRIIARLETKVGLTLFDRANGRLAPTQEARILYGEVDAFSRAMERVKQVASDLGAVRTGHLKIAVLPALALGFLPRVIARFNKQFPGVAITFAMHASAEIEALVANQLIDLGIVEMPVRRTGIKAETFCAAPFFVVLPTDHPLAGETRIEPAHLADVPLVTLTGDQTSQRFIDSAFERSGVKPHVAIITQTNSLICQLVALGLGVGIVDPFTAGHYREQGLASVPFVPEIKFNAGVLYPAHRLLSKSARFFLRILREERNVLLKRMSVNRSHVILST